MPQASTGSITPSFLNCKCNTVSASTPARNPYFNNPIRYSENGLSGIPCIDNQTLSLPNARHVAGARRKVVKSINQACICRQDPPPPRDPCLGGTEQTSSCSGSNIVPDGDTNLGSIIYFEGSSVKKGAMAGTVAALNYVGILSSTECGDCPGDTTDGDLRQYNATKGTWDRALIQFQTTQDDTAVLGNGIAEPFYLDRDYIAAHLLEILGEARLEANHWVQTQD
jgi:hypothetical protein